MIIVREGKPKNVAALKADGEALLAPIKRKPAAKQHVKAAVARAKAVSAKVKPAAKAVDAKPAAPAPKPKPKTRGGRLVQAEREVQAAKPRDRRLCWSDMRTV
jgi:hypothetical protein